MRCLDRVPVPHVTEQSRQRPQLLQVLVRVSAHKKRGIYRGEWGGGMGRRDVGLGRVERGGRRGMGRGERGGCRGDVERRVG